MTYTESSVASLTLAETLLARFAVHDLISRHRLIRKRCPDQLYALRDHLDSSVRGTKTCAPQPQSPPSAVGELIDSTEAATILGCSERWVRDPRFRGRLGGRKVGGRWLFPRQTVVEYAERKAGQHK